MAVTNESTLKELVDETGIIKNDLVSCRDNLKNNLSNKGIDVATTNKMQALVEKVNEIEVEKHSLPEWSNHTPFLVFGGKHKDFSNLRGDRGVTYKNYVYLATGTSSSSTVYRYNLSTGEIENLKVVDFFYGFTVDTVLNKKHNEVYSLNNGSFQEMDLENLVSKQYNQFNSAPGSRSIIDMSDSIRVLTLINAQYNNDWKFDIVTKTFSILTKNTALSGGFLGYLQVDSKVFFCYSDKVLEYDTVLETFTTHLGIKFPYNSETGYINFEKHEDKLYFCGGRYQGVFNDAIYCFDPVVKTYTKIISLSDNRIGMKLASTGKNLCIIGGYVYAEYSATYYPNNICILS